MPTLQEGIRLAGHTIDRTTLLGQLDYLGQKQYINTSRSELSAADSRYTLSATGRDYLEAQELI